MNATTKPAQIVIFAKYPEPGKVKTRLAATISDQLAADFHRLALLTTVERMSAYATTALRKINVIVAYAPDNAAEAFASMLPKTVDLTPQGEGDLGQRLRRIMTRSFDHSPGPLLFLGADSPTLPVNYLDQAYDALQSHDTVVGPSEDGGYYLIGMNRAHNILFQDIDWSTDAVTRQTRERARSGKLKLMEIDAWYDVDHGSDVMRAGAELLQMNPEPDSMTHKLLQLTNQLIESNLL